METLRVSSMLFSMAERTATIMKQPSDGVMSLSLTLLGAFGLWHRDSRHSAVAARLLRWLTLGILTIFELSLVRAYQRIAEDPKMALTALGLHSTMIPTYAMAYSLHARKERYLHIMRRSAADEGSLETARIFSDATVQGRWMSALYLSLGTVYTLSTWAVPLIITRLGPTSSRVHPPYDIWFPVTADYDEGLVAQYIFQSLGVEIGAYLVVISDLFFISLMLKVTCDFKSLNNALVNLKIGIMHELGPRHAEQELRDRDTVLQSEQGGVASKLSILILYHQDLLRDVDELQQLMSKFLFVLYVLGSGNLCALAYEVSKATGFNHEMTSAGSYLMGMAFRLGIYCYYGSEITSESLKVGEALYSSDWLSTSMTLKQSCVLVIGRSNRPVRFTAGMFGALSLDTYATIINTAYSYFMLLKNM